MENDQFLGYKNDKSSTRNTTYSVRFNRELSDKLSLKAAFYKSDLDLNDKGASLGDAITNTAGESIYHQRKRGYNIAERKDANSVLQFYLVGEDAQTRSVSHTFQVGFDYRTPNYSTSTQKISTIDTIDAFTRNNKDLPDNLKLGAASLAGARSRAIGFVAQDVITFNHWLKTFLGIRYSKTQTESATETTNSDAFNPLAGVIITPFEHINVFAS